jgi:hypothetical protein
MISCTEFESSSKCRVSSEGFPQQCSGFPFPASGRQRMVHILCYPCYPMDNMLDNILSNSTSKSSENLKSLEGTAIIKITTGAKVRSGLPQADGREACGIWPG